LGSWREAIDKLEFDLTFSRLSLSQEVLRGNKAEPPKFRLREKKFSFEGPGWNFLEVSKEEWMSHVKRAFELAVASRILGGKQVPHGIRTRLRQEIARYARKRDKELAIAIKRYGLVKHPRHYAKAHGTKDYVKWLVLYQIPPCKSYSKIAKTTHRNRETVRKCVEATARVIELKLRDSRLHAGRTVGSTGTASRRARYREVTPRRKANADK
jgi:hypothetical protein